MHYRFFIGLLTLLLMCLEAQAQGYLHKKVSIEAKQKPLESVLDAITQQTGAVFSYNSTLLRKDSLVTFSAREKSVKQILQLLFGERLSYKEKDRYIILQSNEDSRFWYVSGYVRDKTTGEQLSNVSVYEPNQLVATLTNSEGYFKMRFKGSHPATNINVSRLAYNDASFLIKPGQDQEITVHILPTDYALDTVIIQNRRHIEDTRLGRMFLSSKQKLQSMNVGKFFVDKPYQASFVPAFGTHGNFSSQVVNKISLNIIGGFNAGVHGAEVGGVFNLIRNDVKGAQIGGVYNMVGGEVEGVQVGGVADLVFGALEGVQVSGVYGHIAGNVEGVQVSGVANFADSNMQGWQASGVVNYVRQKTNGVQISGVANISGKEVKGVQVSGVVNYTKKLNGVQLGLINICDTSEGYSIGLINISRNGYHKLSLYTTEAAHFNLGLKTGTKHIYTILFAGMNAGTRQQSWTFGGGIGASYSLAKNLSLNPELSIQHLYLGDWEHYNLLNRISLNLHYQFHNLFGVFAGPAYSIYTSNQRFFHPHYPSPIPENGVQKMSTNTHGWMGWTVGVSLF